MIDVNALIESHPPKGNYFAPDVYLQGDNEFGLLENRSGSRLIALPDTLIKGLFTALDSELGIGAGIALTSCGKTWGSAFYKRFAAGVGEQSPPLVGVEIERPLQHRPRRGEEKEGSGEIEKQRAAAGRAPGRGVLADGEPEILERGSKGRLQGLHCDIPAIREVAQKEPGLDAGGRPSGGGSVQRRRRSRGEGRPRPSRPPSP